jgi:uncharacterized membrane protein YqaE (UPF0057 family)
MSLIRTIFCVIFPPLAVLDCGAGAIVLTFILTCLGWIPGMIAAFVFVNNKDKKEKAQ